MIRKKEVGFTSIVMKDSNMGYSAYLEDFTRIRREFMAGGAFIDFTSPYGYVITLKSACIEAVIQCTPESIKAQEDDEKETKKDELIEG